MPDSITRSKVSPLRIVTSTALFDGHDAAINLMRRVLQALGAEVIHLGHNRSAREIVQAAIQEDAAAVAISSYQGGHIEFFKYVVDLLREQGAAHVQVFGGGGGVIVPREVRELEDYGVNRIYSPEDGRKLGLTGMIQNLLERTRAAMPPPDLAREYEISDPRDLAQCISAIEYAKGREPEAVARLLERLPAPPARPIPVLGITGTGGAGKSSLVDELVLRFLNDFQDKRVAILSVDPTRRRTGGALLGDRIRMNAISNGRVYMRSLATRARHSEISDIIGECIRVLKAAAYDLIIVETAGIGQGDAGIVSLVDVPVYVMTAEFGAASQLEKIDMLDLAEFVVINKFDRVGSEDALRDVRKQVQRNRQAWEQSPETLPVFGTIAARFNDDGVSALYSALMHRCAEKLGCDWCTKVPALASRCSSNRAPSIAPQRVHYLAEISRTVREYRAWADSQAQAARNLWHLEQASALVEEVQAVLRERVVTLEMSLAVQCRELLNEFEQLREEYAQEERVYSVRGRELRTPLYRESLSGSRIPRVALPNFDDPGARLRWLLLENVPGRFPFTAGVFPFKRADEDPTRMFAGEGDPARTNARFKYLSRNSPAKRLSTAFDSVTLYGWDPDERPDIYGKVGSSGVSISTLDDMKQLYDGFDLRAPNTSVSMTINGPAPAILAMFFNTAIDQALDKFAHEHSHTPSKEEAARIQAEVLRHVRGTVQADILKEDQGQNTCIFAIDFALRMMGDIQEYFIQHDVRNFYSVSISGYHIAEAGANPISQLAFTLANGFTYVEHYLTRGMDINQFAPNLSFFFSCGMDPEYSVINRVARRIWAVALRGRYGADERAQKLKTHIQTSGRSLHAQDVQFNDIRTTLEALTAWYDHCNSLHTNAYDEAVTTPTQESVRRALAIQLIINKEHGLAMNENPLQGSFIIDELTDLVEEAVLQEFEQLDVRGGVLGAMERGYQRGKIQDESQKYEVLKSSGAYPIVGVNTFVDEHADHESTRSGMELRRGTEEEKAGQLRRVREFQQRHASEAPAALARLKQVAVDNGNLFDELMHAVRVCSLGQITHALFEVGGQYRRNT
ncbi:MAG: cobalamin B12-binding domain-containing protein [Candidatus Hydrogenedentes bacterium]|nr:cobalamin B12-binding domain-containing protein [Candidatus Hydrogenedentota bacterium]